MNEQLLLLLLGGMTSSYRGLSPFLNNSKSSFAKALLTDLNAVDPTGMWTAARDAKNNIITNKAGVAKTHLSTQGAFGVGAQAAGMVTNMLAGGNLTAAGNVMNKLGDAAAMIPGPVGMIASGVLKTAGGLTNAAFGANINQQFINNKNKEVNSVARQTSNARTTGLFMADALNKKSVAGFSKADVGTLGWFSKKRDKEYNKLKEKASYAEKAASHNFYNAGTQVNRMNSMKTLGNLEAFGGDLGPTALSLANEAILNGRIRALGENKITSMPNSFTNILGSLGLNNLFFDGGSTDYGGGTFLNGLTHINAGSTHEKNPNNGVPYGTDRQGVPNLLEEGEVEYGDYVFSNRSIIPDMGKYAKGGKLLKRKKDDELSYEEKVLKKYAGKTHANAVKSAEKRTGFDERPFDLIAQAGFEADASIIARHQEKTKLEEALRDLLEQIQNMSPEEYYAMQEQMALQEELEQLAMQLQAAAMADEQLAQLPMEAPSQQAAGMTPEEAAMLQLMSPQVAACGGRLHGFGGNLFGFGGLDNYPVEKEEKEETIAPNLFNLGGNIFAGGASLTDPPENDLVDAIRKTFAERGFNDALIDYILKGITSKNTPSNVLLTPEPTNVGTGGIPALVPLTEDEIKNILGVYDFNHPYWPTLSNGEDAPHDIKGTRGNIYLRRDWGDDFNLWGKKYVDIANYELSPVNTDLIYTLMSNPEVFDEYKKSNYVQEVPNNIRERYTNQERVFPTQLWNDFLKEYGDTATAEDFNTFLNESGAYYSDLLRHGSGKTVPGRTDMEAGYNHASFPQIKTYYYDASDQKRRPVWWDADRMGNYYTLGKQEDTGPDENGIIERYIPISLKQNPGLGAQQGTSGQKGAGVTSPGGEGNGLKGEQTDEDRADEVAYLNANIPFPKMNTTPGWLTSLGLATLGGIQGILGPDLSAFDDLNAKINRVGDFERVAPIPIGTRYEYIPDDTERPNNAARNILGQTLSYNRNNTNGNIGANIGSNLAAAHNYGLHIGENFALADANDFEKKFKTTTGNFEAEKENVANDLKAKLANQATRLAAGEKSLDFALRNSIARQAAKEAHDKNTSSLLTAGLSGINNMYDTKYKQDLIGWGLYYDLWGKMPWEMKTQYIKDWKDKLKKSGNV